MENLEKLAKQAVEASKWFHPLRKDKCNGCGIMTLHRDMNSDTGLCVSCWMEYCEDMDRMYGEAVSESENYLLAH